MSDYHTPVLLKESVSALSIRPGGVYVDATFGGGGHSREILSLLGPKGRLLAFDRDEEALKNAPEDERLTLIHADFRFIHNFIRYHGYNTVDGILADLGVSSHQFDTKERGFSFRFDDSPLDMRMNSLSERNAGDIVNSYSEARLSELFRSYGEIECSGRLASLICKAREVEFIRTTGDLNRAIESILPKMMEHKFLAKVYQALRIEVNGEMHSLEGFMKGAIKSLSKEGIISVITYHSLEDRIVKNALRDEISQKRFVKITRKPVIPCEEEIAHNTRARSAKLRVAKKTL